MGFWIGIWIGIWDGILDLDFGWDWDLDWDFGFGFGFGLGFGLGFWIWIWMGFVDRQTDSESTTVLNGRTEAQRYETTGHARRLRCAATVELPFRMYGHSFAGLVSQALKNWLTALCGFRA